MFGIKIMSSRSYRDIEQTLYELREDLNRKDNLIDILDQKIKRIEGVKATKPKECVEGDWCKACMFNQAYHIYQHNSGYDPYYDIKVNVCGKGETCPDFIARGTEVEDE